MKKSFSQKEDKTKTILETIEDGYYELDLAGNFTFFNDALCRMYGRSREELMGMNYRQYLDEEHIKILFQTYNKVYKTGNPVKAFGLQVKRKDGTKINIEISISLQKYSSEKPIGFRGIVRDVTERKLMEEKLWQEQKELQTIMNASPIGVSWSDMQGNIKYNNHRFQELFGYTVEDTPDIATWLLLAYPSLSYREQVSSQVMLLMDAQNQGKETNPLELTVTCKDGSIRQVLHTIVITHNRILAIFYDITERKRMEEKLLLISKAVESSSNAIGLSDPQGHHFYHNKAFTKLFEYTPDELESLGGGPAIYADKDIARDVFNAIMKGKSWRGELEMISKSGRKFPVGLRADAIKNEKGEIVGLIGVHTDITERKKMEETLLFIKKAVESSSDAIGISDPQGRHFYHNKAATELLGYTLEELEFVEDHPAVYANKDTGIEVFYTMMSGKSWSGEVEMISKSGRKFPVFLRADAIKDEGGKIIGLIGVHTDITERKMAEETLKNSEAKYRNIFENALEGIYQVTREGRFITANTTLAQMAGYDSPEDFKGSIKDIRTQLYVHPEDRDRFLKIMQAKGSVKGFEIEWYKKDGNIFWVVLNAVAVKDEQGNILYNEGLVEDITIRKQAEEQLKNSLESLKRAVGTTIQVLVSALEARDPYTAGHQSRSANMACAIATEMGLDKDRIEGIRMASIIHDIGKLSIPAEILTKPTKLTDLEFSLVKEHAQSGYEMLKDVESPWPLADIVHQHHERINGSGYPRNLKVDEILLESRILAVADVVEAMASHRPYRASLGIDAALEEIEKNKGILYDADVADACLKLFREKGYQLITV